MKIKFLEAEPEREKAFGHPVVKSAFTHADVLAATGIPNRTLHSWLQRDTVKPLEEAFTPGGGRRLYSPLDICKIGVLYELTRYTSFPPSRAIDVQNATQTRVLWRFHPDHGTEDKSQVRTGAYLWFSKITENETATAIRFWEDGPPDDQIAAYIAIPVDSIIDRVLSKLDEIVNSESEDSDS